MYNNNNRHAFYLGYKGYSNSLTVSDGGQVLVGSTNANRFVVGWYQASASNNMLTVTGTNSLLSMTCDLSVGYASPGNQMTISNGGVVSNFSGYIGYGAGQSADVNASNNSVLVTGAGALWNNGGNLCIGYGSTDSANNNQMTVSNGGIVSNVTGYIGYTALAANNAATVTSAGALWNNSGDLNVGGDAAARGSSYNRLTITNSGAVLVGGNATIYSPNGGITVSGGSLAVTNAAATGTIQVMKGSLILNSGTISADSLSITATNGGASAMQFNGGTFISHGSTVNNGSAFVVGDTGGGAAFEAIGGTHSFANDLTIGNSSSGNSLLVSNAGQLSVAGNAYLGYNAGANNNSVLVTGSGSVWNVNGSLTVGNSGSGNRLTASNGSSVAFVGSLYIGYNNGANNNSVIVNGATLTENVLSGSYSVNIGFTGNSSGNSLTLTNGGILNYSGGAGLSSVYIGEGANDNNNSVTVTGPGSSWNLNDIHSVINNCACFVGML